MEIIQTASVNPQTLCNGTGFACSSTPASPAPSLPYTGSINTIMSWVLGVGMVLMIVYLIIGVFFASNAGGTAETQEKASGMIMGSVIGIVLIIVAYILVRVGIAAFGGGA